MGTSARSFSTPGCNPTRQGSPGSAVTPVQTDLVARLATVPGLVRPGISSWDMKTGSRCTRCPSRTPTKTPACSTPSRSPGADFARRLGVDVIVGAETGGIPLAVAVSLAGDLPFAFVRKPGCVGHPNLRDRIAEMGVCSRCDRMPARRTVAATSPEGGRNEQQTFSTRRTRARDRCDGIGVERGLGKGSGQGDSGGASSRTARTEPGIRPNACADRWHYRPHPDRGRTSRGIRTRWCWCRVRSHVAVPPAQPADQLTSCAPLRRLAGPTAPRLSRLRDGWRRTACRVSETRGARRSCRRRRAASRSPHSSCRRRPVAEPRARGL